jgi:putative ABC transport system permease protein
LRDLKHSFRSLRQSPGFALAVILTLALGIGGNTAIFSVVDQVLLRPLPYPHGDQLVIVRETLFLDAKWASIVWNSVSPANWLDWQRDTHTFQSLAAWRTRTYTLTGVGEPTRVDAQVVSSEFFPLLGVQPLLGRVIDAADDRPKAPEVAVLSYRMWQQRFGGDAGVVGRVVSLSDRPVQIIGVMPPDFRFVWQETDLWRAFQLDGANRWRETDGRFINVVARLKPDATLASARAELESIAHRLAATYEYNKNSSVRLASLREDLTGQVSTTLLALYAAVAVLLSIACFNVANLLLARVASRRREMAIRSSLGAGRGAIVRQLLAESLLLSLIGGALGIAIARWCLDAIVAFAPPDLLKVPALTVDWRVLLYAVGMSVATGLVVGLVPALLAARQSIVATLRASGPTVSQSHRVRQGLVVGQVALTVVLLCGAGLLTRSVLALARSDAGLDKRNLVTMDVALPSARYGGDRTVAFYSQLTAALRGLPGVQSAAAANSLPVIGSQQGGTVFHRLGTPLRPVSERPYTTIRVVTSGYFHTLGIPILRGREFNERDDTNAGAGFIVNEAFAKAYLAGLDPLSASLSVWMEEKNPYLPIIGVVGNVNEGSLRNAPEPTLFYSQCRMQQLAMTLLVRAPQPASIDKLAVAAVHRIDPGLAVAKVQTFESALSDSVARERLSAIVSGAFAVSGLVLASLGLYGVLAFLVTDRTKEIGIRIALGERLGRLMRSVIVGGLALVAAGAALGIAGSLLLLRSFGPLLFGVTPYDVSTYLGVVGLLAAVAVAASYLPARRAARVEPLVALRQD